MPVHRISASLNFLPNIYRKRCIKKIIKNTNCMLTYREVCEVQFIWWHKQTSTKRGQVSTSTLDNPTDRFCMRGTSSAVPSGLRFLEVFTLWEVFSNKYLCCCLCDTNLNLKYIILLYFAAKTIFFVKNKSCYWMWFTTPPLLQKTKIKCCGGGGGGGGV